MIISAACWGQLIDLTQYATCFTGPGHDHDAPILLTAVPYGGKCCLPVDHTGDDATDPVLNDPITKLSPGRLLNYRRLNNYDSSDVYFFAPGIHPDNAHLYEFRVLLNGKKVLQPWSDIPSFTYAAIEVDEFKKQYAVLGGFRANWGNYLLADIRKKGSQQILSSAAVYWTEARPELLNIYTAGELNEFLKREKKPYELTLDESELAKWKNTYPPDQIDPHTSLPKKLLLKPGDNNVIFYLKAGVYKKDALEYQVKRNGEVYIGWKGNDFDNNFVWLKNLEPGDYTLYLRFSGQRRNTNAYPFVLKAAWYQGTVIRIITAVLCILLLGGIFLLIKFVRQREKMALESSTKERLTFELRSIRSQLNPHFIFNSLSSIQGLINKNEIAAANLYLSEFGNLLRESLATGDKDFTDLHREIALLDTYLRLEQLRFGFQYEVRADESVPLSATEIPAILLQPLVENAVKHGVAGLQEKGLIRVRFSRENTNFIALIHDNGGEWIAGGETAGYGLKLTRERIRVLNLLLKGSSIQLTISTGTGSGTTVTLLFKNWYN